jgi:hypothetical protein
VTRHTLAATPTEDSATTLDLGLLARLTEAVERLNESTVSDLKCYTPAEAGRLLGKTENWVIEAIQDGRIPCTYIGKSPRMTAAHIRQVQEHGERLPHQYAKPLKSAA